MQTTSFELSKKLNELGLRVLFRYVQTLDGSRSYLGIIDIDEEFIFDPDDLREDEAVSIGAVYHFPAYTLDEILEMLPTEIKGYYPYYLSLIKGQKGWMIEYLYKPDEHKITGHELLVCKHNKNPAEAAGQLLVWCIENNYINVEQLNDKNANNNLL